MEQLVSEWLKIQPHTTTHIAQQAGISRTTLHRILNHQHNPTLKTLQEIAYATGQQLTLTTQPLYDLNLAQLIRYYTEIGFPEPQQTPQLDQWHQRLQRANPPNNPKLLTWAATYLNPLNNPQATYYTKPIPHTQCASIAHHTKAHHAISGPAALTQNHQHTPTIYWTTQHTKTTQELNQHYDQAPTPHTAQTIVAPAPPWLFHNTTQHGITNYASETQIYLDTLTNPQWADTIINKLNTQESR